jgi:hypothetical protein
MTRVFLSHASPDRHFVEDVLVPLLQGHGIGTWYSREDIRGGEDFERKILEGLRDCGHFLVVLSPRSVASEWVRREVAWAEAERRGRIVPVLLADCRPEDLHLALKPLHLIDFRPAPGAAGTATGAALLQARRDLLKVWGIDPPAAEGDPSEEASFHERYLASRLPGRVAAKLTAALIAYARDDDNVPCLVEGPPGSGKAAVLAHFISNFRREHPQFLVLPYFIGSRPASTALRSLLRRFCAALAWRYGPPGSPLPEDLVALKADFARRLGSVPAGERVVLVIDALDRLDPAEGAHDLGWLPKDLPGHVKVVLGCDADAATGAALLPALNERVVTFVKLNPYTPEAIQFEFAGHGSTAPAGPQGSATGDRLYLDVGNALRPGVIDNHQLGSVARSTTSLVLEHPHFVREAVDSWRQPHSTFTFVLHTDPDLDCAAAAYLANAYLTTGRFPDGARVLSHYVDRVDAGYPGFGQGQPFTLYAAHLYLGHRLGQQGQRGHDKWDRWVRDSLKVIDFVLGRVAREGRSILEVDAFECPGLFGDADRAAVLGDLDRYRRKLADPRTNARKFLLRLPCQLGGEAEAEALLVRDVINPEDPGRCIYFKDWARTDEANAPRGRGFVALSVSVSSPAVGPRCILSVRPDSGLSLEGLGAALERAEAERRVARDGRDHRLYEAATGERRPDRPGYGNPDPWYDGREQGYTIVDGPRAGTVLSAEEIEKVFLDFGKARPLA